MSEAEIARLREEIADVDKEIVGLIAKRLHLAGQVGLEKKLLGHPIDDEGANDLVHTWLVAEFAYARNWSHVLGGTRDAPHRRKRSAGAERSTTDPHP